jgi:hypothetical protein
MPKTPSQLPLPLCLLEICLQDCCRVSVPLYSSCIVHRSSAQTKANVQSAALLACQCQCVAKRCVLAQRSSSSVVSICSWASLLHLSCSVTRGSAADWTPGPPHSHQRSVSPAPPAAAPPPARTRTTPVRPRRGSPRCDPCTPAGALDGCAPACCRARTSRLLTAALCRFARGRPALRRATARSPRCRRAFIWDRIHRGLLKTWCWRASRPRMVGWPAGPPDTPPAQSRIHEFVFPAATMMNELGDGGASGASRPS